MARRKILWSEDAPNCPVGLDALDVTCRIYGRLVCLRRIARWCADEKQAVVVMH